MTAKDNSSSLHSGNQTRLNPVGQNLHIRNENTHTHRHHIGQNSHTRYDSGSLSRVPYSASFKGLNSGGTGMSSLEGFNAVRQALLRTSSVIKDIDHMLEKKT